MGTNEVPDFIFMGDIMQFEACREYSAGDNRVGFELQEMTVFMRRDDVRAVLAADHGGIIIMDSAWHEYDALIPDSLEYNDLYRKIVEWRMGKDA